MSRRVAVRGRRRGRPLLRRRATSAVHDRSDKVGLSQTLRTGQTHRPGDLLELRQHFSLQFFFGCHCYSYPGALWHASQSSRKRLRPRSVSGCFTSALKTECGSVATSAPTLAESTTCCGE